MGELPAGERCPVDVLRSKVWGRGNGDNIQHASEGDEEILISGSNRRNKDMEYGFYGRLKEEFPSQVIVDINDACNYECIHCPNAQMKREGKITGSQLSEELNRKMVDEVAKYGRGITQQIRYTADGEPFLHPEVMELLEYAVRRSGTMVSVTTNGSLLDEEKMLRLQEMGLGLIDFSLDAYRDGTYSEIRRNGDLEVVRRNVLKMLEIRERTRSRTKIVVSFVLQEKNKDEKDDFEEYWKSRGVDWVIIRKLHTAGGTVENDVRVGDTGRAYPCVYLWERILLDYKGRLSYCPVNWEGDRLICQDYSQTSIKDVWNGEEYRRLRQEHLTNCFSGDNSCRDCKDRFLTIWPEQGELAYGDMLSAFQQKR